MTKKSNLTDEAAEQLRLEAASNVATDLEEGLLYLKKLLGDKFTFEINEPGFSGTIGFSTNIIVREYTPSGQTPMSGYIDPIYRRIVVGGDCPNAAGGDIVIAGFDEAATAEKAIGFIARYAIKKGLTPVERFGRADEINARQSIKAAIHAGFAQGLKEVAAETALRLQKEQEQEQRLVTTFNIASGLEEGLVVLQQKLGDKFTFEISEPSVSGYIGFSASTPTNSRTFGGRETLVHGFIDPIYRRIVVNGDGSSKDYISVGFDDPNASKQAIGFIRRHAAKRGLTP